MIEIPKKGAIGTSKPFGIFFLIRGMIKYNAATKYPNKKAKTFTLKPNSKPVLKKSFMSPPPIPPLVMYEITNIVPLTTREPESLLEREICEQVKIEIIDSKIIIKESLSGMYLCSKSINAATMITHINIHIITDCIVSPKIKKHIPNKNAVKSSTTG